MSLLFDIFLVTCYLPLKVDKAHVVAVPLEASRLREQDMKAKLRAGRLGLDRSWVLIHDFILGFS